MFGMLQGFVRLALWTFCFLHCYMKACMATLNFSQPAITGSRTIMSFGTMLTDAAAESTSQPPKRKVARQKNSWGSPFSNENFWAGPLWRIWATQWTKRTTGKSKQRSQADQEQKSSLLSLVVFFGRSAAQIHQDGPPQLFCSWSAWLRSLIFLVIRFGRTAAQILQNGPPQLFSFPSGWLCSLLFLVVRVGVEQPKFFKRDLPTSSALDLLACAPCSFWWSVLAAEQPKSFKTDLPSSSASHLVGCAHCSFSWSVFGRCAAQILQSGPHQLFSFPSGCLCSLHSSFWCPSWQRWGDPFWRIWAAQRPKRTTRKRKGCGAVLVCARVHERYCPTPHPTPPQ